MKFLFVKSVTLRNYSSRQSFIWREANYFHSITNKLENLEKIFFLKINQSFYLCDIWYTYIFVCLFKFLNINIMQLFLWYRLEEVTGLSLQSRLLSELGYCSRSLRWRPGLFAEGTSQQNRERIREVLEEEGLSRYILMLFWIFNGIVVIIIVIH